MVKEDVERGKVDFHKPFTAVTGLEFVEDGVKKNEANANYFALFKKKALLSDAFRKSATDGRILYQKVPAFQELKKLAREYGPCQSGKNGPLVVPTDVAKEDDAVFSTRILKRRSKTTEK